ncbi:LIM/homeobox protein Awh [Ixodes scapularis]
MRPRLNQLLFAIQVLASWTVWPVNEFGESSCDSHRIFNATSFKNYADDSELPCVLAAAGTFPPVLSTTLYEAPSSSTGAKFSCTAPFVVVLSGRDSTATMRPRLNQLLFAIQICDRALYGSVVELTGFTEQEACSACGELIADRFLLKVSDTSWHARCLRCCVCQTPLDHQPSCFVRHGSVYCRPDYVRQFAAKCAKCGRAIGASDWVRRAREQVYHLACFACDACKRQLSTGEEFALHDGRVLCKTHYFELLDCGSGSNDGVVLGVDLDVVLDWLSPSYTQFAAKCAKCGRAIGASDWVRRAREQVYHLACFACDACKRQLSTGEEFALHDGRVLCKTHYFELLDCGSGSNDENSEQECGSGGSGGSGAKAKTKRVRTTFTEEQLQVLQANFNLDSNPDGQDLERIAQITGLSKRVTQVWFQNSRARQKKYFNNQAKKVNPANSASVGAACPGCGMLYCLCAHPSLGLSMGQVA